MHTPSLAQLSHSAWTPNASYFGTTPPQLLKEEEWPKFTWDLHFFIWFLKISTILDCPEWGNGILTHAPTMTPELEQLSSRFYHKMIHYMDNYHLLLFFNNQDYNGKGIKMLQEIFASNDKFLGKMDHKMQQEFTSSTILPSESLDDFTL
eukprot:89523-Ditylum_brightwellii.AAC.1